jgi:hypothetical protein
MTHKTAAEQVQQDGSWQRTQLGELLAAWLLLCNDCRFTPHLFQQSKTPAKCQLVTVQQFPLALAVSATMMAVGGNQCHCCLTSYALHYCHQVSFLLPAGHGLHLATTTVGLLDHLGCLHCIPRHLADFTASPLSSCGPTITSNIMFSPSSSSSSSSTQVMQGLQLLKLQEDAAAYTATLRIGGTGVCSGLSVQPAVLNPAAGLVTHELGFSVAEPPGLGEFILRLLHPVDSLTASKGF